MVWVSPRPPPFGRGISLLTAVVAVVCLSDSVRQFGAAVSLLHATEANPDKTDAVDVLNTSLFGGEGDNDRRTERVEPKSSATGEASIKTPDENGAATGEKQEIHADAGVETGLPSLPRILEDLQRHAEYLSSVSAETLRREALSASPGCKDVDVTADFVRWSFDILITALQNRDVEAIRLPDGIVDMQRKRLRCPAFVTWYKRVPRRLKDSEDGYELRGCIGTLSAITPEEIGDYALIAAQEDSRFPPIQLGEVPTLKGTVTVLHSFERAKNSLDWEIGVHGLAAKFHVNGQLYSSVYLPQVMVEFETKVNGIAELIRKAQYFGEITEELLDSVQLTKFQGTHRSLSFSEYKNEHGVIGQASRVQMDMLMEKKAGSFPEELASTSDAADPQGEASDTSSS